MKSRNALITAAAVAGVGIGSFGLASAGNDAPPAPPAEEVDADETDDDSDDVALTGAELDQASAAALAETGEGTIAEAEAEDGGFEVEVTLDDGSEVEVLLDADFKVTGQEADDADDESDDD